MSYIQERLQKFTDRVEQLSKEAPNTKKLLNYMHSAKADGKLDSKQKALIAVGIALYHRCEDCVIIHTYNALQAGATREEILETAEVAMIFGGGPTLSATAMLLQDTLDAFEKSMPKPK
ncbi:MAG: carboxymuconolactone decarboxylase family protein [Firmicutes bacterium]|nr:carboxymuconolactone decarboxylase family protein [Bacillota bacterium]